MRTTLGLRSSKKHSYPDCDIKVSPNVALTKDDCILILLGMNFGLH